jgi:hypothetical protein
MHLLPTHDGGTAEYETLARADGILARGHTIPVTVRELPMIGATIVSLVGAPGLSSDDESSMSRPRSGTGTARSSPPSSFYIRLLAGSRSGSPPVVEPVLITKTPFIARAASPGRRPTRALVRGSARRLQKPICSSQP